ncbi:MAG: SRPBCC domain-containing protein [Proteobacteria bacterium]|nr:SRPBCC domain-containing protein [Pseudomonadota bacterium]
MINRAFDAPINVMFEMWSDPKHLAKWVPPTGFSMEYLKADIRPGGRSFYRMFGNGIEMYGQANYIELVKPNRIVYSQNFCDKDGNMSRHPMAPTWPATMLTKITLAEEDTNKTRVTIAWECLTPFSAEEIATFIAGRPGMTGGWTGSLDKLEDYLSKL